MKCATLFYNARKDNITSNLIQQAANDYDSASELARVALRLKLVFAASWGCHPDYYGHVQKFEAIKLAYEKTLNSNESAVQFSDTDKLLLSYKIAIKWAVENGIVCGYEDGTFRPNDACTRAHVVSFLWRAAGCPEPETTVCPFSDVSEDAYYYKAILWASENGIVCGYEDGTFRPDAVCTRAHVVAFLWRYEGRPESFLASTPLKDITGLNADFTAAIFWAVENGITVGYPGGLFRPNAVCTRAQIVTFLYRAFA